MSLVSGRYKRVAWAEGAGCNPRYLLLHLHTLAAGGGTIVMIVVARASILVRLSYRASRDAAAALSGA